MSAKKKVVKKRVAKKANGKLVVALDEVTKDREQFRVLPTVGEDGKPPASLLDLIPDFIGVRVTWAQTGMEQAAAVWLAFDLGKLEDCPDPRLRVLAKKPEDLRGHSASPITAPHACLVRSPRTRFVTLAVQVPEHMQSAKRGNWRAVAAYTTAADGRLPEEPRPAKYELPPEALARIEQLYGRLTDHEAKALYRPISEERLVQTHVQRIEIEAVLYRVPHGSSGVLWVKDHKGWLWACGLVRGAALRHVEAAPWPDPVEAGRAKINRMTMDVRAERLRQDTVRKLDTSKAAKVI